MTDNHVVIKPETHKNVKVRRDTGYEFTAKTHVVPIVINEFSDVAGNCPIVFVKDETGDRLRVAAMMGLEAENNLLVRDKDWMGTHIPMNLGRVPFSFKQLDDGKAVGTAIDMDSSMVSETDGEPLFDENGEATDYMKNVNQFLANLFQGEVATQKFSAMVEKYNLLREFKLQMVWENGTRRELVGLFTPAPQTLQQLSDEAVLELHKEGFLAAIHIAIQSMTQVKRLVRLNNETSEDRITSVNMELAEEGATFVTDQS